MIPITYLTLFALVTSFLNVGTVHTVLTRVKSTGYCLTAFALNTAFVFVNAGLAAMFVHDLTVLKYIHYLCAFSYIVYIYLVFGESLSKKLFAMFSVWMFSMIALLVAASFVGLFSGLLGSSDTRYLANAARAVIQALLLFVLLVRRGKTYKKVLNVVSDKIVGLMSLYPVIGFLLLVNNYTLAFGRVREIGSVYELLFFLAFIVLGYVLVFAGILSASRIISLQYDVQTQERDISERKRVAKEQAHIIAELRDAISEVKQLSGLLPICASCKRIRNDKGGWEQLESYIRQRSKADFSHAICPECAHKLYPEYSKTK